MQNLLIEQKNQNGLIKTWRVRPQKKNLSIGSSKEADLNSGEGGLRGFEGYFEYTSGRWTFHSLQGPIGSHFTLLIDGPQTLEFSNSSLVVTPLATKSRLLSQLTEEHFQPQAGKYPYLLTLRRHKGQILSTLLEPEKSASTLDWISSDEGTCLVEKRTVYLKNADELKGFSEEMDKTSRVALFSTLGASLLLALMFLISPESKNAQEIAQSQAPPPRVQEIKTMTPKKKRMAAPAPQPQQQTQPNSQARSVTASSSNRAAQTPQLGQTRLSQLIGKISARGATSKNVVIANGVEAGSAPTGRALASIGQSDQAGVDWSKNAKGQKVGIQTVGQGTGTGVQASLNSGKAGQGGVGLLEEDGEVVGGLDREVIAAYIKSRLGEILYCYERELSARPDLYGKVGVKFTIGASGSVETQRVQETTLRSAAVEGCILQRVARWKFPTPQGGTQVVVTYPFLFKSTN